MMLFGHPFNDSFAHNALIHDGFMSQFSQGVFYPRWLPDLYGGFGGASGFFYPPLLFYFSGLLDFVTLQQFETPMVLSLTYCLFFFMSGASFFIFAQKYTDSYISCICALLYICLPYHFSYETFERGAAAEIMAYIWVPLIFFSLHKNMLRCKRSIALYSFSYIALILSHLPTALLATPFIGLYTLFISSEFQEYSKRFKFIAYFMLLSFFCVCSTSLYLFPALKMQGFVYIEALSVFPIDQTFLDIYPLDEAYQIFIVGFALLPIAFASLILGLFYTHLKPENKIVALRFGVLALIALLMMTSISRFIWDIVPILKKVQFAWRITALLDFFSLAVIALTLQSRELLKESREILAGFALICLIIGSLFYIAEYNRKETHIKVATQKLYFKTDYPNSEHIPRNDSFERDIGDDTFFSNTDELFGTDRMKVVHGSAQINIERHVGRTLHIHINAHSPATLQVKQFMFPGWRIQDIESQTDVTERYQLRGSTPYAALTFDVPEGQHELSLYIETNIYEKVGALISIISLIFIALWIILFTQRSRSADTQ